MAAPLSQVAKVYANSKSLNRPRVYLYQCATLYSKEKIGLAKERKDKDGFRILEDAKMPPVERMFTDGRQKFYTRKTSKFIYYNDKRPARFLRMSEKQDWTNVWPSAHTFTWSSVPLPVRQGQIKSKLEAAGDGLSPSKYGNLELMKIPNFLHLTPNHVRKHCIALKKFTTPWPADFTYKKPTINTESEATECEAEKDRIMHKRQSTFPLEIITSDYCFAGPSIRDDRARFVTIKFPLDSLQLNEEARDKFIKLVGPRYNSKTGIVQMKMGRCPLKAQNYEYLMYQLTALYFESMNKEAWEDLITEKDMLNTPWGSENSKQLLEKLLSKDPQLKEAEADVDIESLLEKRSRDLKEDLVKRTDPKPVTEKVYNYKVASENVLTGEDDKENIKLYKEAVLNLLNMKKQTGSFSADQQDNTQTT